MQEKDQHEKWVQELGSMMSYSYVSVHRHVADRLAALLALEPVKWVDGNLVDHDMSVSGSLSVFTESLVALVTLDQELRGHDFLEGRTKGTTDIVVLARRTLTEVRLASNSDERYNEASTWCRFTTDGRPNNHGGWPSKAGAPVDLVYGDRVVRLNGPVATGREGLADFLPSVMRDLAQS